MPQKEQNAVKTVGAIMLLTLLGKVLGLVRDQLLAANYGALGLEAAAFSTASRIPRIFFDAVFASAVSASFIPIFNEYLAKKGKDAAFQLSHRFITLILMITTACTVLGILGAEQVVWFFADGLSPEAAPLAAQLLRVLFPTLIFTGLAFSFVGVLQSMESFAIPAAMSAVANLVIILYYIFGNARFGVYGLAIAFLIGWGMQAVIQLPALSRKGYHYRPSFSGSGEGLQKIGRLMLPVMLGTWIQPVNIMISTKFASHLYGGAGGTLLDYANNLYSMIVGILVLSVSNVIFPRLSRLTVAENNTGFGQTLQVTLRGMVFLLLPMMLGLMMLSQPLVQLVYERGAFDPLATELTSEALFFFAIGMLGFGIQTILSRAFYAVQDGKTPFWTGLISIFLNVLLCFLLMEPMGIGGLALASAISSLVSGVLLLWRMGRRVDALFQPALWLDVGKMLVAALVMTGVVVVLRDILLTHLGDGLLSGFLVIGIPAGVGVLLYFGLTYALRLAEGRMVYDAVMTVMNRIKGGKPHA